MRFSTRAEYGLRAIVSLAKTYPTQKNLQEISKEEKISMKYLERLFVVLKKGKLIKKEGTTEVWSKELSDGSKAVGLFNRGDQATKVTLSLKDLGMNNPCKGRDIWQKKDLDMIKNEYTCILPPHGSQLLKIQVEHQ